MNILHTIAQEPLILLPRKRKRFALVGGPGAGKTEIAEHVEQQFAALGRKILRGKEAATWAKEQKVTPERMGWPFFQSFIAFLQVAGEEALNARVEEMLANGEICDGTIEDRGLFDGGAYLPGDVVKATARMLKQKLSMSFEQARDRYDCIIHLVTAADGAPEFYKRTDIRPEDIKRAKQLDRRILKVWASHPRRFIVSNVDERGRQISFDEKKEIVLQIVLRETGVSKHSLPKSIEMPVLV